MRKISKGQEPASLTSHRASPFADYQNYTDKDKLRAALVSEQRGLCCFCLKSIPPSSSGMKIAHWMPVGVEPVRQLDYGNLLGACLGGEKSVRHHCDTAQKNQVLLRNPADSHFPEEAVRYLNDGSIESDDASLKHDLAVLQLDNSTLRNRRKAVLDAFVAGLARQGPIKRTLLQKWLGDWNGTAQPGPLRPYCMVVVYWLKKKLAKA